MVWREVLERFLLLLLSMSFLVVVAVTVSIFVVDSPLDLKIRAWIYEKIDQPDRAMKAYVKLAQVDPGNFKALETAGDLYAGQGADREAATYYAKAAQLNRSVPNLLKAAVSAQKAGLKEEASKFYQQVLTIEPENPVAQTNMPKVAPPKPATSQVFEPKPLEPPEKTRETQREDSVQSPAPPKTPDRESDVQQAADSKTAPAQTPVEVRTPKSVQPCNQMLKEIKEIISSAESDNLAVFKERIGEPVRTCESENRKIYCFKCIVRGRLTETIEIMEKDNHIESYFFGSCTCDETSAK
jgi:tetratricopeptide (TPR) repeat protein